MIENFVVLSLECCAAPCCRLPLQSMIGKSDINKEFGRTVARLRISRSLSQEELAYRSGIHRTYIGAVERGEKSPTLNTIFKISQGLSISIVDLWAAMQTD